MLQEPVKLLNLEQFKLLYYRLLPEKRYYLHTGNVSAEWFPRLNTVHQIVCDLEISTHL